jgi:DNA polymerase
MQYLTVHNKVVDFFENLRKTEGNFIYFGEPFKIEPALILDHKIEQIEIDKENMKINKEKIAFNVVTDKQEEYVLTNEWQLSTSLDELYSKISNCLNCSFGNTRTKLVFGVGNPEADIMVIGEGPGADEDLKGEPFVGRAGQLLTKILEAINLNREDVYIANIVKCRPPGNKTPTESEFAGCLPYLKKQIEIIKPKFILTLGAVPLLALFGHEYQISKHRGKVIEYQGIKVIPTYHPAYLLRNPAAKKFVWEDVQLLERMYKELK